MASTRSANRGKVTSNTVIDELIGRERFIVKTMTRRGPVYTYSDTFKRIIPGEVAERLIAKRIVISDGASLDGVDGQAFRLSATWGGSAA